MSWPRITAHPYFINHHPVAHRNDIRKNRARAHAPQQYSAKQKNGHDARFHRRALAPDDRTKQCNCSGRSGGSARTGTGTGTADRPSCTARAQSQHSSEKPRRSSRPPVARWSAYCQAPGPVSGSTRRECLRAQLRPRCSQRHGGGRAGQGGPVRHRDSLRLDTSTTTNQPAPYGGGPVR